MDLSGLFSLYAQVPGFALVLARLGGMFVAAPLLGGPYVSARAKSFLVLAIALVIHPIANASGPVPADGFWLLLLIKETALGLSIGWFLNLFFQGVKAGGELVNRHAGFSAAENFDPDSDVGEGPMGDLMHLLFVLLFLSLDGHHLFIAAIARSYEVIPPGGFAPGAAFGMLISQGLAAHMTIAVALSFPVLGTVLLITMAEGVITRAVPQVNIMPVSFAVKILASVFVVWAGLPAAVAFLGTVMTAMQNAIGPVLKTLG